ncbi:MAG: hypothetical protein FWD97_01180 [Defluviitaleaceae bacterium]|nr:hypothetical protein [Defluviitaleaceae bacterium]
MDRNSLTRGQNPYYSSGSTARQVAHEEVFQPRPNRVRVTRKRVKAKFAEDIQVRHLHALGYYAIFTVFLGCVAGVFAISIQLQSSQVQLESATSRLSALTVSNAARESEIHANLDLTAIEYIAINQLGMMPPEDFQRVVVVAPPQAVVVNYDSSEIATSRFSFTDFWRTIVGND